ncbi:T7SS effector LXG polymorphic toxin [Bacillus cereus]|uniref:T7SS effector LXG polymorphic toxin n=1 Tax=Bacillus cereus TaxID=1396 RepID=UPI000BF431E5|nr:T7SS effector LXG polymorphic toxin [Bacillus cereus]PFR36767.1 hypothetical protein COK20_17545 [Bacillus cereus]PFW21319.1 hypothetical protein COL07_29430 [Bacillus cereus]
MSLNMYLGEVQNQTQSMNAVCMATIQGMEQAIQSIDAFASDTVLQGQTYESARTFFVQTFRPLAQGIIFLCEELIRQNNAFPNDFESQVASTDVIEQELLEQIREIDRMKASMEAINQAMPIPGMEAMANLFTVMRKKLQKKLYHLHEFNQTSSNNYSTAIQLAASIATGLAEVQSGKGFNPASGTFSTRELNMEWLTPIQEIMYEQAIQDQIEEMDLIEKQVALSAQKDNRSWYEKTAIGAWEYLNGVIEFFQGAGSAAAENFIGLKTPDNDKLESKITYQAGRLTGNALSMVGSVIEIFEGISLIGGSNFLTIVAEIGTGGLASPIVLPLNGVATVAGAGVVGHGGFVLHKSIQNAKDTLQKFQSSSNGSASTIKKSSPKKVKSLREQYLGKTPGKKSRTGREVIEKMKNENPPRIRTTRAGKMQFKASDGVWYDLSKSDMAHLTDAVSWWNSIGRHYGAKSKEVRKWMLDSVNYELDHFSLNRSAGAKLGERYLPPTKK